jgi:chitodextrinase
MSRHRTVGAVGIVAGFVCSLLLVAGPAAATPDRVARDRTPPTTPTSLRITSSTANRVSLEWNRSTDSSTFWYCVQTNGSGCIRVDPPRTTLTRTFSLPSTTFAFSVYAVDATGNRSASSNTVSFATSADTTPPSPAPVLSVTGLKPTRAVLSWPQAVDDFSTQVFTTLFVDGRVLGYADRLGPPSETLLTLTPETTYVFQVSVRDRDGNTVTGPPLEVTTPPKTDEQAPTAPTGLRADTPDGLDLELAWNASTDDSDPAADIRYDVYVDGVLASVSLRPRTVVSCTSSDPVAILVRAVDTSGNVSGPSNTVVFEDCAP